MSVHAILLCALLFLPQEAAPAAAPPAAAPSVETIVSVPKIREALSKPPALRIAIPEPTYRITVQAHPYFREVPYTWGFSTPGVPLTGPMPGQPGTPLVSFDLLPLLRAAAREHAEHAAQDEVKRALAQFCATNACP